MLLLCCIYLRLQRPLRQEVTSGGTGHAPNVKHLLRHRNSEEGQRGILWLEERTLLRACCGSCSSSGPCSGSRAFHRRNSLKENGFSPSSARGPAQLTSWSQDGVRTEPAGHLQAPPGGA